MNHEPAENLDELIAEEKRLVAEEHLLEAWSAGLEDGIENTILAASFARRLLLQLSLEVGPQAASDLLDDLAKMDERGEFVPGKTLQ